MPEAGFIDNNMVALLIAEGAITPEFAAAVLSVDLTMPVFSEARAALLAFVPDTYAFQPLNGADPLTTPRHPDALAEEVIARIQAADPPAGTPAAEFLILLQQGDPVAELRRRVRQYRDDLGNRLAPGAESRADTLQGLYDFLPRAAGCHGEDATIFQFD